DLTRPRTTTAIATSPARAARASPATQMVPTGLSVRGVTPAEGAGRCPWGPHRRHRISTRRPGGERGAGAHRPLRCPVARTRRDGPRKGEATTSFQAIV